MVVKKFGERSFLATFEVFTLAVVGEQGRWRASSFALVVAARIAALRLQHPDPIGYGLVREAYVEVAGRDCMIPGLQKPVRVLGLQVWPVPFKCHVNLKAPDPIGRELETVGKMDSTNSMKSPVAQPQSSQDRQRKRPRNPTQSPSMASQESDMANSSRHMDVGNALHEAPQKSVYEAWTETSQAQLFGWLELPGNYDRWKFAGVKSPNGSTSTSRLTKKAVTCLISKFLDTLQTKKTPEQVMSKMRYVEKKFKEAEDYLRNTGEGITSIDEKLGIVGIREKVLTICPFYFQVKSFMSESVVGNPPHIGETGMKENMQEMLPSTSTGQRLYESIAQQGGDGNSEEEESSADEEPNFEEEICAEQEPIPQVPSQDCAGTPVPETTLCRPNPNWQQRKKKKKPKSFQEFIRDMQEQNRALMEKKLDIQLAHQDEFLQLLREQSQKQFALESRRLDLELMRMEQQREDSRIRELALQVELQKLRGNS